MWLCDPRILRHTRAGRRSELNGDQIARANQYARRSGSPARNNESFVVGVYLKDQAPAVRVPLPIPFDFDQH
jgi:hypothetical protein